MAGESLPDQPFLVTHIPCAVSNILTNFTQMNQEDLEGRPKDSIRKMRKTLLKKQKNAVGKGQEARLLKRKKSKMKRRTPSLGAFVDMSSRIRTIKEL